MQGLLQAFYYTWPVWAYVVVLYVGCVVEDKLNSAT